MPVLTVSCSAMRLVSVPRALLFYGMRLGREVDLGKEGGDGSTGLN